MIKCPNCQAKYPENALFCDECGAYLLREDQKETVAVVVSKATWMERGEMSEVPGERSIFPLGLKLTIPDSGRNLEVPLTKRLNIGRLDPASNSFPEIDLTSDGGLEKGVSRRHAQITRRGDEVFVEDLGSVNGTCLNLKKIIPYLPQALKSGDKLQLGRLMLQVSFR
jgi:pSer/pThr/pTyr-binding forkhead associated (FHA) protein